MSGWNPYTGQEAKPLEAVQEVSTASFDTLYSLYANDVLRVCYFYLGDRQRAEDVCCRRARKRPGC